MPYTYDYPRPCLSADIAVFRLNGGLWEILLVRRGKPPYAGMWSLPGGFMEIDEPLETTAVRELAEETGLTGVALRQFRAYSEVDRDPRTRVVTVVFFGKADPANSHVTGGDDAAEAAWFPTRHLPSLAFDHARIVSELSDFLSL